MKNDIYLKSVLTVIAVALTVLVLQNANLISSANAEVKQFPLAPMEVKVVDWDVRGEVKVEVSRWTNRDKVNVNIDEVGGWFVSNGVLKVDGQ